MTLLLFLSLLLQEDLDDEVKVARDSSLTVEAYKKQGFPDPDRAWTPADYAKALEVLRKIASEDSSKLPRRDSPASGKVWTRLCSDENLALLRDDNRTIKDRWASAQELNAIIAGMLTIYAKPASSGGFDQEAVDALALMLRFDITLFDLLSEAAKGEKPAMKVPEKDTAEIRKGVALQVQGALLMMTDRENVRMSALLRFAREFKVTFPKLLPHLPEADRKKMVKDLKTLIEIEYDERMKTLLEEVLKALPKSK